MLGSEKASGVMNLVNSGSASRYEYVAEIAKLVANDVEVTQGTESFKRVAPGKRQ